MATSKTDLTEMNDLTTLNNLRKVTKGQLTKASRLLEGNPSTTEIKVKLEAVKDYWDRYKQIQDKIDSLVKEENVDEEINYRCEMEDKYLALTIQLNEMLQNLTSQSPNNSDTLQLATDIKQPYIANTHTSSISLTPYHPDESITNFIKRLEIFLHLRNQESDSKHKVYTLLHALTPQLHQQLYDICAPETPLNKTYDELVSLLIDFIDPQPSVWALQHKFISRTQQRDESVNEFSVALKKMTVNCSFNCSCGKSVADMFLRLQFIRGLRDTDIRTRLLQDRTVQSYKEIVDIAGAMELAKTECGLVSKTNPECVYHLQERRREQGQQSRQQHSPRPRKSEFEQSHQSRQRYSPKSTQSDFDKLRGKCYRCGAEEHRANRCRFVNSICHKCNKTGHLASVCLQNRNRKEAGLHQRQTENEVDECEQDIHEINKLGSRNSDKFMVNIDIEGRNISMELDTGAALSTISYSDFKSLNINRRIFHTNVELRTYTGELLKTTGVAFVKCIYKEQDFTGKLYIINQKVDPIFGRDWLREVKLDWADIKSMNSTPSQLDDLLQEYSDIFEEKIGSIPNDLGHFRLIDGAKPIFIKPRQVPYALKEKVEEELQRLETNGIITKVEHSDFATPIVPIVKPNGKVRICADYKVTINKLIKEEKYPIPRIEDIFAQMNGGEFFCTLDISNAYLHMNMTEESAMMQTLSTHQGLYKVNRLMFGVKVAPSLWQRFMDKTLHGLNGVQCFFDDIIIQGKTSEELLERIRSVFERLRSKDLKLNRDKCKFYQKSIQYLGHIIDKEGLHKTQEKVQAILNSKRPQNVSELRTFLGLANYYNKFIKHLATILNPLNQLLRKENTFRWTDKCEESFKRLKKEITSDHVLVHFNPELQLVLATDASPVGLGAVLSHRYDDGSERPISFASRTLTQCEKRYSQIDKEATGIYWGLKKFFPYLYGRKFTLITDHKPLVSIFNPHKTLPSISATRIFNYAHFLSGFDYTIEYRNSSLHSNADYLSRFPFEQTPMLQEDNCFKFQANQLNTLLVDAKTIAEETGKDKELKPLLETLQKGLSVEKYGFHDNELTLQDGCILKGWRVVIPESLRTAVLRELHTGHLGMTRMKALARSHCTWKTIDSEIEQLVKECRQCRLKQNDPAKEMNHPWQAPSSPWERVHIDFAGPISGQWYFIVVDAFTKWVEILPTKNTSTDWCIKELSKMFANFGLPLLIVSDNGSNFTSKAFEHFLDTNGVCHKTTAPYHPSSNGQAERFVQTVKNSLRAMEGEKYNPNQKLFKLLMHLRQAPNSTGTSAYHLMFGRPIRTHLSLLFPEKAEEPKQLSGVYRLFKVGDRVQARDYSGSKYKWSFGKIIEKESKLLYKLKMDDGAIWRRHIDQILKCQVPFPATC